MSLKQPVRYPVKYYSHLDAGAPQLADADGVIKTILKACLVTGYGDKEDAGWTALFDDAFRIVLRRPLRTGNPPDIKIENGVINGAASHRIVSQDNPTSLDDATELAAGNFLARHNLHGNEWHLVVSDFGFMLCYQVAYSDRLKNYMLFVSSAQKWLDADVDYFVVSESQYAKINGTASTSVRGFLDNSNQVRDMRSNVIYDKKMFFSVDKPERYVNNDYLAQSIAINYLFNLPFFCSIPTQNEDLVTKKINIDNRPMLRYFNAVYDEVHPGSRPLYIPLDYWEL